VIMVTHPSARQTILSIGAASFHSSIAVPINTKNCCPPAIAPLPG
jgi:hypothetical protein